YLYPGCEKGPASPRLRGKGELGATLRIEAGVRLDHFSHLGEVGVVAVGRQRAVEQDGEALAGRQRNAHRLGLLERGAGVLEAELGREAEVESAREHRARPLVASGRVGACAGV